METLTSKIVRWQGLTGSEREHLVLTETETQIIAESIYMSSGGADAFGLHYRIVLDAGWNIQEFTGILIGSRPEIRLRHDTVSGAWFDGANEEVIELRGATDLDISITPFTNTLPINRLKLEVGQSADIRVAYITLPERTIMADPQRYTRVSKRKYLFESVDTEFKRELEVDDIGLVVDYPDFFSRIS